MAYEHPTRTEMRIDWRNILVTLTLAAAGLGAWVWLDAREAPPEAEAPPAQAAPR